MALPNCPGICPDVLASQNRPGMSPGILRRCRTVLAYFSQPRKKPHIRILPMASLSGPTKSRPEPSRIIRNSLEPFECYPEPSGVHTRSRLQLHSDRLPPPGAIRTPPEIQLLNFQKGINHTQIPCSVPLFCHIQDKHEKMRKIMSLHVMQKLIRL